MDDLAYGLLVQVHRLLVRNTQDGCFIVAVEDQAHTIVGEVGA